MRSHLDVKVRICLVRQRFVMVRNDELFISQSCSMPASHSSEPRKGLKVYHRAQSKVFL